MSATWLHFHSALEVMTGVNLALFGFDRLRQPSLDRETQEWSDLIAIASLRHRDNDKVLQADTEFRQNKQELAAKTSAVKGFCAVLAAFAALVLFWATYAAEQEVVPWIAWGTIIATSLPPIILIALDAEARQHLIEIAARRNALEREICG